jgi:hypothetical protein
LWHTLRTLELVYSDAYNSQLNDRYAGKRDEFRQAANWAYGKLVEIGIGISGNPIPQAAAPQVAPVVVQFPDVPLPDGTYFAVMAWTNVQGEEGAPSTPTTITTTGSTISVQPGAAPQNAVGWNFYAGLAPDSLSLQNNVPIAVGQSWLQPGILAAGGRAPGSGQTPTYLKAVPQMIQRG